MTTKLTDISYKPKSIVEAELATREWAAQRGRLNSYIEGRTLLEKLHANFHSVNIFPQTNNEVTKFDVRFIYIKPI